MVGELHKRGYQGLRVLPTINGAADDGEFVWHCHLVLGRYMDPDHGAHWTGVEMGNSLPYSITVDGQSNGWTESTGATARDLADSVEDNLGGWLSGASQDDFAYAGWFVKLLGVAEHGYFPYAGSTDGVVPGDEPLPVAAWPDGSVTPTTHAPLPSAPKPQG